MTWTIFRRQSRQTIAALYGAIVAQARHPAFYRNFSVPDTVEGRFEMILLHLALLLTRLRAMGDKQALGQGVFDAFCHDMDGNLREMGVGDLTVPKQMLKMGEAFYGRVKAYESAFESSEGSVLTETLQRNVYGAMPSEAAEPLAAYVRSALAHLSKVSETDIQRGAVTFPMPPALAA